MSNKSKMNQIKKVKKVVNKENFTLTLLFSAVLFGLILLSILISWGIAFSLMQTHLVSIDFADLFSISYLLRFLVPSSLIIGFLVVLPMCRFLFLPINKLTNCINTLASGNFKVRLAFGKPISKVSTFKELTCSFNKLTEELENTEMLRRDFINNFSHEFKTPIVSIAGFAKLLKRGNLDEAQKMEYLTIIEEESMRLSYMATNVLNLTRIENQTILTDVSSFNLSEQLRSCILLLEPKWEKKHIFFNLNFDEYMISANEELLKQVWINLIENAIKFSPDEQAIDLNITEKYGILTISITNRGPEIPEEKQKLIFNKFYQADESHSAEGNGIGLAIVRMITELHRGVVSVTSKNSCTTFTVQLPDSAL